MGSLTLRFWGALHHPPLQHPLFRRVMRFYAGRQPPPLSLTLRAALAVASVVIVVLCLRLFPDLLILTIFFLPLTLSIGYTLLHGTLAGAFYATRISSAIARERERGMLDLLALSPRGRFDALWAICTGCQYYDQTFRGQGNQRVWFARLIFLSVVLLSGTLALSDPHNHGGDPRAAFLVLLITVFLIALAFEVDDIHSSVIGSLVGLIVPMIVHTRFDARLWGCLIFLILQVIGYLLAWIAGFLLVPILLAGLPLEWFAFMIALPFEQFLIFFASREIIGRILWSALVTLTRGELGELSPLMQRTF